MSRYWDSGILEPKPCEEDCLCLTDFRPIHIPAISTKGIPIPSPTPRPTLTVSELPPALEGDEAAVAEFVWEDAVNVELVTALVVEAVDVVKAVEELELELEEL